MANYSGTDAIGYVKPFIKSVPLTVGGIDIISCDLANSRIWMSYPWRWTLGSLTAIPLVDGTQDYSIGNNDHYRPINLWVTRTDLTPDQYQEFRSIVEHLPPELTQKAGWGNFCTISWEKSINKYRLQGAAAVPTGTTLQINGDYQKIPTKITALATALVQDDAYFEIFCDWLLYYLYKYTDDSRMGGVQMDSRGNKQYTGQYGKAMESLEQMRMQEDAGNGVPLIFPNEPLGSSGWSDGLSIYG